jgi:AsmA-like C-terminal region
MAAGEKNRRWWPRCRLIFRRVRICTWMVVLVLVAIGGYLNEVGLPGFVKRPLLNRLQARGVDLQFSRLRLRWYRGVVADDVRFGRAGENAAGLQFRAREVEVKLNPAALLKFHLSVDSLILHRGRLVWAPAETSISAVPSVLAATNIEAQLRFLPGDEWALDHFTVAIDNLRLHLSVSVTNASALRDWPVFHPRPGAPPERTEDIVRRVARILDQLKFAAPPDLIVNLDGDARNIESFHGLLTLNAPSADTPWGTLTNGTLLVRLTAGTQTNQPQCDLELRAGQAVTEWAAVKNLQLHLHAMSHETLTNVIRASMEISADEPSTEWARASNAQIKAEWTHSPTNAIPLSGVAELHLTGTRTRWGSVGSVDLDTRLDAPATDAPRTADESWGWWAALEPYPLDWNCRLGDIHVEDERVGIFELKELACGGNWRAPELTLTNAHAQLYRGHVETRAVLNVATREANFSGTSDFDAQKALPLLTKGGREWLGQYSWTDPPLAHVSGTVVLPAWTNHHPDWRGDVLPTLFLQGDVKAGEAGFRGVPVSSAAFQFTCSNMVWTVPDLVAVRPEGALNLFTETDNRTQRFHIIVRSTLDPRAARPLLPPGGQRGLDSFVFTRPPVIEAEVWGRWHDPDQLGVAGSVTVTNFSLRGDSATLFHGNFQFTNNFLTVTDARVEQGSHYATATGLGLNLNAAQIYLTNGFSTIEPVPFFRAIGPQVTEVMSPYHFGQPPTVQAYGTIPLAENVPADLHFKVDGGPFNWLKFNLDHISGGVDWVGDKVTLTNVQGAFYQGRISGAAAIDCSPDEGAICSFQTQVTDADLHTLMADVYPGTNHLEGRLTGLLDITHANTVDPQSWQGGGQVDLRDGLIWEIPIFGILSPVLEKFQKGWGQSRVDRGEATFTITNSIIHSDNLLFRSPAVQIEYRGTVDFSGRVDATVQAQLLRGLPLVGPLLSIAFSPFTKLFEYKVTGTLTNPKSEPLYDLTKLLMIPLNPIHTLEQMVPSEPSPGTNTPPVTTQPP